MNAEWISSIHLISGLKLFTLCSPCR